MTSASFVFGAVAVAAVLFALSPMARHEARANCTASSPCPPTPVGANIVLDTAAGGPNTHITVTGSSFLPNESMSLFWDTPSHVATSVTTDSSGNFTKVVTPFPGDRPGVHKLCASAQPNPCANFALQGPPTPTPPASPSHPASPSATPTSSTPTPSASPVALNVNSDHSGLDVITKPPFVFLPIIGLLALLGALAYWILMRVDRTPALPSASVVHRSARPDLGPLPAPPGMQPPPMDLAPPAPPTEPLPEAESPAPPAPPDTLEPPEPPAY